MKRPNPNPEQFDEIPVRGRVNLVEFFVTTCEGCFFSGESRIALAEFGDGLGVLVAVAPMDILQKLIADYKGPLKDGGEGS